MFSGVVNEASYRTVAGDVGPVPVPPVPAAYVMSCGFALQVAVKVTGAETTAEVGFRSPAANTA